MKRYHVFYNEGYGCCGFESFGTEDEAISFIMERMRDRHDPELDDYDLVYGEYLRLVPATVITTIKTERA